MIQLKPGLQPSNLAKNRKSLSRRRHPVRKKRRGLHFSAVFSDPAVSPFDAAGMGTPHRRDHRRQRQGHFQAGERRGAENLDRARDQDCGLEVLLRRHRQRDRSAQGRPRDFGAAAHPSRHPHDRRLGHRRRIFRRYAKRRKSFTTNSPGSASINTARSTRRSGSTSASITSTGSAKAPAREITSTIARPAQAERAATQYEYPQGSACFIQSVDDTMEDIMRLATSEAMLFKYGSGTGTDLSTLRSTREKLSGGGKPSGPLSFPESLRSGRQRREMRRQDAARREDEHAQGLASGHRGIHRRQAEGGKQSVGADRAGLRRQLQRRRLRLGHVPERESDRARERRVHERGDRRTRMVDPPGARRRSRARERMRALLLRKIAEGTHICGDPGMQFDTTIHKWHTCKGTGRQNSTNPCSEYLFLDNTACNLASLNLMKFKTAGWRVRCRALQGGGAHLHHRAGDHRR